MLFFWFREEHGRNQEAAAAGAGLCRPGKDWAGMGRSFSQLSWAGIPESVVATMSGTRHHGSDSRWGPVGQDAVSTLFPVSKHLEIYRSISKLGPLATLACGHLFFF